MITVPAKPRSRFHDAKTVGDLGRMLDRDIWASQKPKEVIWTGPVQTAKTSVPMRLGMLMQAGPNGWAIPAGTTTEATGVVLSAQSANAIIWTSEALLLMPLKDPVAGGFRPLYVGANGMATTTASAQRVGTVINFDAATGNYWCWISPDSPSSGSSVVGQAFTRVNDTNVTMTLTGSPLTALINAMTATLGWTGLLGVARGGLGLGTVGQGDILYGSATNAYGLLAKSASTTRYLANTGTNNNPAWDLVNLSNGVTGTLAVANGGTGGFAPPKTLFDHYADVGNSGSTETDLYSDTLASAQFAANGDKIEIIYAGTFAGNVATTTPRLRVYFDLTGATNIYDSAAMTLAATPVSWQVRVTIIRESSTVLRFSTTFVTDGDTGATHVQYTRTTGLTLSGPNVVKITGTSTGAAAANNDIVGKLGTVLYVPAA